MLDRTQLLIELGETVTARDALQEALLRCVNDRNSLRDERDAVYQALKIADTRLERLSKPCRVNSFDTEEAMELEKLRTLGETVCQKTLSIDGVFCRHGKNIYELKHNSSSALGRQNTKECPQCDVEMEILERLERIELFLRKECSCEHPEYPCSIHDHPDGTPKRPGE